MIFDLDGTLINHFNVIYRCYCHALAQFGVAQPTFEEIKRTIGSPIEAELEIFLKGPEHVEEAVKHFRAHFREIFLEDIQVLPGAAWILNEIKALSYKTALLTNKPGVSARKVCAHLGLDRCLDHIVGVGDTAYHKPQPELTLHVMSLLGAEAEDCCMVGDSTFDIETAKGGNMACHTVASGSHTAEELQAAGATGVYNDLYELGTAVFGLTAPAAQSS